MLHATWTLRPDGHTLNSYHEYRNHPTAFTLKINHGGTLTSPLNVRYRGGKANWFEDVDADSFSAIEVQTMVKDLGYVNKDLQFYYKIPNSNLDIGLKPLSCEKDVMKMCDYVSKCKVMDVFVIHPISEPQLVSNPGIDNEFDPLFSYPDKNTDKDRPSGSNARVSGSNTGKTPMVIEEVDGTDSSVASEDSEDSDFDVGEEDRIKDVEVDMADFRKHTDGNVEWVDYNEEEVQVPPPFDYEATLANKQLIKEMVSRISIEQIRKLYFTRTDKIRMTTECRGLDPVFGNGSGDSRLGDSGPSKNAETWWVKRFDDNHTCLQSRTVGKCTASFLSKEVEETIKPNPKVKQYAQLRQYALELKEQNPYTTIKIDVERCFDVESETRQFRRIYICLGALKSGFKAGKIDLLGLDGCFLSGPYPGHILTVVGVDPNNRIYPLAYAVVESKTKDSWLWFLDCLGDDLELFRNSNITFISYRQKGLIPASQETFPTAEHRYYLKHIYDNMKLQWRGEQYKDLLWRCAAATTVRRFGKNMEEIKKFNKEMYEWLKEIPPHHWVRSHFSGRPYYDVLLNNMCEVLNRQLLNGRDKPIITCLEFIREYLMKRIVIVQGVIRKSTGPLTPNATKVFNVIKREAAQYKVVWNGGDLYETTGPHGDKCVVNITLGTCACRKWEITGMPCKHTAASIWKMASNGLEPGIPESWVHETYWMKTWEDMYSVGFQRLQDDS
ncbi:mutator type transposase [Tanacetum coccineum]